MKLLRKLLFPFSVVYWIIMSLRNKFYDLGWLESKSYSFPLIAVGNLSTGGTGKSPMIEFLISNLKEHYKLAVLSRGYGRKSKGFKEVLVNSAAIETGDEPLQFKRKFPDVSIAVCEDRQLGIGLLEKDADLILLDDAFQHRKVRPSYTILLSTYGDLYVDDWVLPVGNLRESKSGADRADAIVVTKCPGEIGKAEMEDIRNKLNPKPYQRVFFTKIGYGNKIINESASKPIESLKYKQFTLVTGIANPKPLVAYLNDAGFDFTHKSFPDHHNFSLSEIEDLEKEDIILTTEKDFMRLQPLLKQAELYYLPIKTIFHGTSDKEFLDRIIQHINIKRKKG